MYGPKTDAQRNCHITEGTLGLVSNVKQHMVGPRMYSPLGTQTTLIICYPLAKEAVARMELARATKDDRSDDELFRVSHKGCGKHG